MLASTNIVGQGNLNITCQFNTSTGNTSFNDVLKWGR